MIGSHFARKFVPLATLVAMGCFVGSATAEVVALRRGSGPFGLFHNNQISPVFQNELQSWQDVTSNGRVDTGSNTISEVTGSSIVQDTQLWGGADVDSTGPPNSGGTTWDEPGFYARNNGVSQGSSFGYLGLMKFNVAQASGLIGGTIQKAEMRLFFSGGDGPDDDFDGSRSLTDAVGRVTSNDWVEGNKHATPPGEDDDAQGVNRYHPASSNTTANQDIFNVSQVRTRGRWFDPDGVIEAGAGPGGEDLYRTLLGSDYDNNGFTDGDDLARWTANFGIATPVLNGGFQYKFPLGDDDLDGDVDGADFLTWQRNAGTTGVGIFGTDAPANEGGSLRGYFGSENPGGDVTYQAPTWGDGNDYFNPDPVDYTSNPDFAQITLDGVTIYGPKHTGGDFGTFPVSPIDGVSPGDGDVANEVDSIDATSIGSQDFDMEFEETEAGFLGGSAGFDVWDVTGLIQALADGEDNFGFYLRDQLRLFGYSETTHGADFAPVLFIDYTPAAAASAVPEPASIVLLGLSGMLALCQRRRKVA